MRRSKEVREYLAYYQEISQEIDRIFRGIFRVMLQVQRGSGPFFVNGEFFTKEEALSLPLVFRYRPRISFGGPGSLLENVKKGTREAEDFLFTLPGVMWGNHSLVQPEFARQSHSEEE